MSRRSAWLSDRLEFSLTTQKQTTGPRRSSDSVFRPLVADFPELLRWFWFSRYLCLIGVEGEDRGDCDFAAIPDDFKQAFAEGNQPGHRSLRFRFNIENSHQAVFETALQQLIAQHGYAISDIRDYDQVGDVGGNRFLGVEKREPGGNVRRAILVTQMCQVASELVIDALIGPDDANRFHFEHNDVQDQNPNGSTFESLHHMFCNITEVPVSVLIGTFWGRPSQVYLRY